MGKQHWYHSYFVQLSKCSVWKELGLFGANYLSSEWQQESNFLINTQILSVVTSALSLFFTNLEMCMIFLLQQ